MARLTLKRWGWYPAGGGEVEVTIVPARGLSPFSQKTGGRAVTIRGLSAVSRLPRSIAERQSARTQERLAPLGRAAGIAIQGGGAALGPGTLLFLAVPGRAGFSALGRRGLRAEAVADQAVEPLLAWVASGALVDDHLADQLIPFLSLTPWVSTFTCPTLSPHLRTVAWVVQQFLPARIDLGDGTFIREMIRITTSSL